MIIILINTIHSQRNALHSSEVSIWFKDENTKGIVRGDRSMHSGLF